MEKKRSQKLLISPYLILVIAIVCSLLILLDLCSNIDDQVALPWEGPSPTPTLWWRKQQDVTPTPPPAGALFPQLGAVVTLVTPMPVSNSIWERNDG